MDSPLAKEIGIAIEAVQAAARLSQGVLGLQDKSIVEKNDFTPVTKADFAIQALLTATLYDAFPQYGFVGEEDAADLRATPELRDRVWDLLQGVVAEMPCKIPESRERMCEMIDWCGRGIPLPQGPDAPRRVWVFDPIDGTKMFVRGEMYAINVALLEEGKQVLSVVACPLLSMDAEYPVANDSLDPQGRGCILFAVKGHGAYVRPLPGPTDSVQLRKIGPYQSPASASQLRCVTCYNAEHSGIDEGHQAIAEKLGASVPGCDLMGSVPRWAALALGLGDFTVWVYKERTRPGKLWDHAGAVLLFEEAGGKVTDVDGKDLDFSVGRTMTSNYGFVAAQRDIHHKVLRTVHEILRQQEKWEQLGSN